MTVEIPSDRLPCPRCGGTGHLRPAQIRGVCQSLYWDMTVEPFVERACGRPIDDYEWRQGKRHCPEHERQIAALAELGREQ